MPARVGVPAQDRIVPPGSARVLANLLPQVSALKPSLGHIGMVVSKEAPATVWRPLRAWLLRHSGPAAAPRARRGGAARKAKTAPEPPPRQASRRPRRMGAAPGPGGRPAFENCARAPFVG